MPTPSPIIVASAGAVVGHLHDWPSTAKMLSPATRPMIAVMIGRPMATALPKVKSRMTTAATRPTTSDVCVLGLETFWPR